MRWPNTSKYCARALSSTSDMGILVISRSRATIFHDAPFPAVCADRQDAVAASVAQRLHHSACRIERGEAGDAGFDGGAANLKAVLYLDALADFAAPAGDRVQHQLHAMLTDEMKNRVVAGADAPDGASLDTLLRQPDRCTRRRVEGVASGMQFAQDGQRLCFIAVCQRDEGHTVARRHIDVRRNQRLA